jgi:pectate lyase
MTMTTDKAVALAEDLGGRSGFGQPEGGTNVMVVSSLNALKAASVVPGNLIVADPALPMGTVWSTASINFADDTTFDAPAGNLTLNGSLRPGNNCIVRRVTLGRYGIAADIAWINPATKSNIWLDSVRIVGPANDGGLDIAASTLTADSPSCFVTVSNCTFEDVDKTLMLDSLQMKLPRDKIFLSLIGNTFTNCRQRMPRVGPNAVVHALYNTLNLAPDAVDGMSIYGGTLIAVDNKFTGPPGQQSIEFLGILGGVLIHNGNDWGELLPPPSA